MSGGRGLEYSSAIISGGKFSLGRLKHGSGYCVGAIVETRMGLKEEKEGMTDSGKQGLGSAGASVGSLAGNGMRDVWVIGERFFRGVGGVFDVSSTGILLEIQPKLMRSCNSSKRNESDFKHTRTQPHLARFQFVFFWIGKRRIWCCCATYS